MKLSSHITAPLVDRTILDLDRQLGGACVPPLAAVSALPPAAAPSLAPHGVLPHGTDSDCSTGSDGVVSADLHMVSSTVSTAFFDISDGIDIGVQTVLDNQNSLVIDDPNDLIAMAFRNACGALALHASSSAAAIDSQLRGATPPSVPSVASSCGGGDGCAAAPGAPPAEAAAIVVASCGSGAAAPSVDHGFDFDLVAIRTHIEFLLYRLGWAASLARGEIDRFGIVPTPDVIFEFQDSFDGMEEDLLSYGAIALPAGWPALACCAVHASPPSALDSDDAG